MSVLYTELVLITRHFNFCMSYLVKLPKIIHLHVNCFSASVNLGSMRNGEVFRHKKEEFGNICGFSLSLSNSLRK